MRKLIALVLCLHLATFAIAQKPDEAKKLIEEGIAYHDKGDYEGAIARYDQALELDKDNLLALAEKAMSLMSQQKYDDVIACCKRAIKKHEGQSTLANVYVTYGNALDAQKKTDKSLEVYDEGIKSFPGYYQLHFNRGITLSSVKKYDEALLSFQTAATLNPKHASSHNAIARLQNVKSRRIPALLAYCRFLVIEPKSARAKDNLAALQQIMKGNTEKKDEKNITINLSMDELTGGKEGGKTKENNFSTTELILGLSAALDYDEKNKDKTDVEQFIRKFETVCASLSETRKDNSGFYWNYYAPYFIEMKEKNLLTTFAYVVFVSSEKPEVVKWIEEHKSDLEAFFEWSKNFSWKTS